jgi:hypothetical protein
MSCLPNYKSQKHDKSAILNEGKMHVLSYYLPATLKMLKWKLLYTPSVHGDSHINFFEKVDGYEQTLLVIKDTMGHVFGTFATEEWWENKNMYGTGESWVFTFRDGNDLEVSPATESAENEFFQFSNAESIIVGGDQDQVPDSAPAFQIRESFMRGKSGVSRTYENPILCGI